MKVNIMRDDFSTACYELQVGDYALEFVGKQDTFSLPYAEIKDFCITKDRQDKTYFTMVSCGRMYEGLINDSVGIESFTQGLREKISGVINIEVRK